MDRIKPNKDVRRMKRTAARSLWGWATALVVLTTLAAVWGARAPDALSPKVSHAVPHPQPASVEQDAAEGRTEKIEAVLAQVGCPGWMVLASEGESALQIPEDQPPAVVPQQVRQTSLRLTAQPPHVRYPVPVRVAARVARRVRLAPSSPEDPDDLLDGADDLLLDSVNEPERASAEQPEELLLEAPAAEEEKLLLTPAEQLPPAPTTPEPVANPPLFSPPTAPSPHSAAQPSAPTQSRPKANLPPNDDPHHDLFLETLYPSAETCKKCHEKIYDEWSISSHAYAMASPMFHKFEQKINDLSNGTLGYFCYRCHSPAGVSLGISRAAPLWELPKIAREGITCVACHRVSQRYGKVNGERRIDPGDIFQPVYGPIGGDGVAEAIARKNHFKVKTSPHETGPGQNIHTRGICFEQIDKSAFCASCHQVAVHPGVKLEVVWEQYRASPACKKGISCQDCHMGRLPGVPSGYEVGAAAVVNDKPVRPNRKHANHIFYGPGYSIAHPGIFPQNPKAERWSGREWLQFDYRAGWGTKEFENRVDDGQVRVFFPPVWAEVDDRYDAREIIDDNLKRLDTKHTTRIQLMENGSHVDGPFFDVQPQREQDLRFHYVVTNTNEGHNLPSGSLGAQPQLWANVVLIGPRGQRLWESGYTDRWGDVADIHSEDVQNKRIPFDSQLFNLQTMFLITGANGTDREFFLPINLDIDQLAFIRPGVQPISVINHPPFVRMEGRSIAPLGSRKAPYRVPQHLLCEPGRYRLSFRLRSRMEPIYFMRFCGSTTEMQRAMNEGMIDFHQMSVEFEVR